MKRWSLLKRELSFSLDKVEAVVMCCIKLHNLCMRDRLARLAGEEDGGSDGRVFPQADVDEARCEMEPMLTGDEAAPIPTASNAVVRTCLLQRVRMLGIRRPTASRK